jgi:hypothetical protein
VRLGGARIFDTGAFNWGALLDDARLTERAIDIKLDVHFQRLTASLLDHLLAGLRARL